MVHNHGMCRTIKMSQIKCCSKKHSSLFCLFQATVGV